MFRRNMLLQYSGFKREPQKKYVSRLTENEAGTNAVSGPRGEDHTKKHLEDENLQHRREKPQIPRDEQCLQGRNIYCKSSFTYIYKLLTLRRLTSYIYGAPILDVSRSHTATQHSR